jgi:hypothetical protein
MSKEKKVDSNIIAALIGVTGTIIVTLITVFANRPAPQPTPFPTWTPPATSTVADTPVPTDTVPAGEPTSTPEPDTPTPEATFTPQPPEIGGDWANDCITARWVLYPSSIPTEQRNGCLVQLVDKFYTNNGRLAFSYVGRVETANHYGLFAQLPSEGTVDLSVLVNTISNGEVLVGIFAEPDINSSGAVLVFPESKSPKRQEVLLRIMPDMRFFSQPNDPLQADTSIYDVSFDFNAGTVRVKLQNKQIDLGSVPVPSANKWLFLGYRVVSGANNVAAEFFSPVIQAR